MRQTGGKMAHVGVGCSSMGAEDGGSQWLDGTQSWEMSKSELADCGGALSIDPQNL